MASSLNDLVPLFYGRDANDEGGQQDPAEFIKNLTFAIDGQVYADETRNQTATRVIFRTRLQDKALLWYQDLAADVRGNWQSLEAAFLARFALVPRKEVDQTWFLNLVLNLKQRGRSIVDYTREGDQLNAKCPEKFRDVLGHQFIAGLDDKGKVDLVQVYLGADKSTVTYTEAKEAVSKAYRRFGEPSPLDQLHDPPFSPPPTPVQSELVALLQALRIPQPALPRDNAGYRSNHTNANAQDQTGRSPFYRGIHCHNCREEGHYSTSCTRLVVSGAQREANRRAIDELQGALANIPGDQARGQAFCQLKLPQWPSQVTEERDKSKVRPVVKEVDNNPEYHHAYPITNFTQSHKSASTQVSKSQDFWPTSRLTRPAVRSVEKPLVQQASQNLERSNEKTVRPPSLSPPPPEDDKIEDSTTIRGNSYGMKGALHPGQDRQVQFEDQDDGAYDRPTPQHYQRKTPPLPKAQEVANIQAGRSVIKRTTPIEMREGKNQFPVELFRETSVPPIWQRLDQSPQSKVQLTQAIASSWGFKGEKKLAGPNLVGTVAVASKFRTPPAIGTIAHKDKEGYDQLSLERWVYKAPDQGPGAKTIWGRSLPEIMPLINGRLVRLHGFTPAKIMPGYVPERKVTHGEVQKVMPGNTHGAMREAIQGKMEEIEKKPEGLSIEKMIDGNGRNSELLWSDQYRKITRDMEGTHRPPDPIPRAKSNHLSLSIP